MISSTNKTHWPTYNSSLNNLNQLFAAENYVQPHKIDHLHKPGFVSYLGTYINYQINVIFMCFSDWGKKSNSFLLMTFYTFLKYGDAMMYGNRWSLNFHPKISLI